mmetsp:Transcript_19803/g.57804  ORF Transcript_19803/g.57804 Transcript_19803/m.57804 type:complete len:217 (-) Transcript_19803:122-772(-)
MEKVPATEGCSNRSWATTRKRMRRLGACPPSAAPRSGRPRPLTTTSLTAAVSVVEPRPVGTGKTSARPSGTLLSLGRLPCQPRVMRRCALPSSSTRQWEPPSMTPARQIAAPRSVRLRPSSPLYASSKRAWLAKTKAHSPALETGSRLEAVLSLTRSSPSVRTPVGMRTATWLPTRTSVPFRSCPNGMTGTHSGSPCHPEPAVLSESCHPPVSSAI